MFKQNFMSKKLSVTDTQRDTHHTTNDTIAMKLRYANELEFN